MNETGGDVVGDPISGSSEELLREQGDSRPDPDITAGDTKPDPDGKKLKPKDFESKIDDGDVPG